MEDPFDRPHRAEPESPDELLAMIQGNASVTAGTEGPVDGVQ